MGSFRRRSHGRARAASAFIAAAAVVGAFAGAPENSSAEQFISLAPGAGSALGSAWSGEVRRFVSERGTCVSAASQRSEPLETQSYSLVVLSRVAGNLQLGVHAVAHRMLERLEQPELSGAARRLARQDEAAFKALCGEGFVAGQIVAAQWTGELDVASREGAAAYAWLRGRAGLGPTGDAETFLKTLEELSKRFEVRARILPDGNRFSAQEVAPAELIARVAAFAENAAARPARAYVAIVVEYTPRMRSGLPGQFALGEPEDPAVIAFGGMQPRQRFHGGLIARTPRPPPARAVAPPLPLARVERIPVRVFQIGTQTVYASPVAPPDHYVEFDGGRAFWVPGAAAGTVSVRAVIQAARRGALGPLAWVQRHPGGLDAVYRSEHPPAEGIFRTASGSGFAWIPGVAAPSRAQLDLVERVAEVSSPAAVSTAPASLR